MKVGVRWSFIGAVMALALAAPAMASASVSSGEIVTPPASSTSNGGSAYVVETLEGVVTGSLPLVPGMTDSHFVPAADGSMVSDGDPGPVWGAHPDGTATELDSSPYDFDSSITYGGSKVTFARRDPATGASDIYVVNADGSGLTLVASGGGNNYLSSPEFSPDGSSIAYACAPAANALGTGLGCGPTVEGTYHSSGVMLMNADGTDKRLILLGAGDIASPVESLSWSPDGQWLALDGLSNAWSGTTDVYAYRTDGSDLFNNLDPSRQVTHETDPFGGLLPQFCGNSTQIVYLKPVDDSGSQGGVSFVIDRDGSGRRELSLSPDGGSWGRCVPPPTGGGPLPTVNVTQPISTGGNVVIPSYWLAPCRGFVVVAPNGAFRRCTSVPADSINAAVEPTEYAAAADGSIVFSGATAADRSSTGALYSGPIWLVHPDGSALELDSSPYDGDPSISPDGSKVAFARFDPTTETSSIYVVDADGSHLSLIASNQGSSRLDFPTFSPDGSTIAYAQGTAAEMLVNVDGTDSRMIVLEQGGVASWSPDGQWLALDGCVPVVTGATRTCTNQVFAYRTNGSDVFNQLDPRRQITHEQAPWETLDPQFTPDGTQILYGLVNDQAIESSSSYLIDRDGANRHATSMTPDPPVCQAAGGCFPQPGRGRYVPAAGGGGPSATVSPTEATVPDVRALSYHSASQRLLALHLKPKVTGRRFSARIPRGHVLTQFPRARAHAPLTRTKRPRVKLILSRGRRPRTLR